MSGQEGSSKFWRITLGCCSEVLATLSTLWLISKISDCKLNETWDYSMSWYSRGCTRHHFSQLSLPNDLPEPASNAVCMLHTAQCPAADTQMQFYVNQAGHIAKNFLNDRYKPGMVQKVTHWARCMTFWQCASQHPSLTRTTWPCCENLLSHLQKCNSLETSQQTKTLPKLSLKVCNESWRGPVEYKAERIRQRFYSVKTLASAFPPAPEKSFTCHW